MADDLGTTEREIIAQRMKKAEALRALGVNPFGNGWQPGHLAADLARRYGDAPADEIAKDPGEWSLAGRVLAVRSFGKAAFLRVRDRSGELQVAPKSSLVRTVAPQCMLRGAAQVRLRPPRWSNARA